MSFSSSNFEEYSTAQCNDLKVFFKICKKYLLPISKGLIRIN